MEGFINMESTPNNIVPHLVEQNFFLIHQEDELLSSKNKELSIQLEIFQTKLEEALAAEDYEQAALLHNQIKNLINNYI